MAGDINELSNMPTQGKQFTGAETFGLLPDSPLVGLPMSAEGERPQPGDLFQDNPSMMRSFMQENVSGNFPQASPAFPTAMARAADRTQGPEQASYAPFTRTEKQPDQVSDPYFDPRKAAEAMIQSGDTQLMMAGYKLLSEPTEAQKPQLVTRWNPETKQEEQVWMIPGSQSAVMAGLKKPEAVNYNQPFMPDGTPNLNYQKYKTGLAKEGATRVDIGPTRVENITTQESEGSKVYGKGLGEMQVQIQKQGFAAPSKIANLDRMSQLLDGVDSGRFSGLGLEAARFAKSLGMNVDPKLGNKQAAEALAIEMALAMREPGSGPMTDKDFDNYLNTVPSLAKTAEGRKEITATLKAKARRDVEISKMAREYAKKNRGVIDDNFLDQIAEYMAANPVVPIARDYGDGWKMRVK